MTTITANDYYTAKKFPETINLYYSPVDNMVRAIGNVVAKHLITIIPVTVETANQPTVKVNGEVKSLNWDY